MGMLFGFCASVFHAPFWDVVNCWTACIAELTGFLRNVRGREYLTASCPRSVLTIVSYKQTAGIFVLSGKLSSALLWYESVLWSGRNTGPLHQQ